jgi:hypothetical protein
LLNEPEFVVLFVYFVLFWQLMSLYYDGHVKFFKSQFNGYGKQIIIIFAVLMGLLMVIVTSIYLIAKRDSNLLTTTLYLMNLIAPSVILGVMFITAFKFSGAPIRSASY